MKTILTVVAVIFLANIAFCGEYDHKEPDYSLIKPLSYWDGEHYSVYLVQRNNRTGIYEAYKLDNDGYIETWSGFDCNSIRWNGEGKVMYNNYGYGYLYKDYDLIELFRFLLEHMKQWDLVTAMNELKTATLNNSFLLRSIKQCGYWIFGGICALALLERLRVFY